MNKTLGVQTRGILCGISTVATNNSNLFHMLNIVHCLMPSYSSNDYKMASPTRYCLTVLKPPSNIGKKAIWNSGVRTSTFPERCVFTALPITTFWRPFYRRKTCRFSPVAKPFFIPFKACLIS